jgi:hypothetical protein
MICRGRHTVTIYRLGRDRSLDTDARAVLRCTAAQVPAFTTSMLEAAVSPEVAPQSRLLAMLYFKNNVIRRAAVTHRLDPRAPFPSLFLDGTLSGRA